MITDVALLERSNRLVSSSKDSFVKIWDLETQHCIQTLIGHRSKVWSLDIDKAGRRLITGSVDAKLRIWSLDPAEFDKIQAIKEEDGQETLGEQPQQDGEQGKEIESEEIQVRCSICLVVSPFHPLQIFYSPDLIVYMILYNPSDIKQL